MSITDEDKAAITAAATAFIEANDEGTLEEIGATQEIVERFLELQMIQHRMEPQMSADVDTEVSDEEAAQRKIEYVLFAMDRSKPEIRNIRAYLLTALYNAPATMDSYYSALVSHDLNL